MGQVGRPAAGQPAARSARRPREQHASVSEVRIWRLAGLLADPDRVRGFVTERTGGVSEGRFATLNLAYHVGDEPGRVAENRHRACVAGGVDLESWVVCRQVHGSRVRLVRAGDRGRGAAGNDDALPAADAMITEVPGLTLVILVADCVPILLFDPERPAIGLAHAGWRGTAGHVGSRTVGAMSLAFGSRPGAMRAVIGPSIGPDDFAVGAEVAARLRTAYAGADDSVIDPGEGGNARADLWRANVSDLVAAGLARDRIDVLAVSTARERGRFFSHRAGDDGRFAACLALP